MGKNKGKSSYYVQPEQPSGGKEVTQFPDAGASGFRGWEVEAPRNERNHASWEDKSTGSYCRYNSGVQCDGEQYREYENVSFRDAQSGHSGKYYYEEKFERAPQSHGSRGTSSSNYIRHNR